ncbi:hypothetical protein N9046_04590 [Akkermansiaceae bacterium]|nr:hypothetical protein [Akkermansiaceae bacterium]
MKNFLSNLLITQLAVVFSSQLWALDQGFTDSHVSFYGDVRQIGGAGASFLSSGELEMTVVNELDSSNRVQLRTKLHPSSEAGHRPYSYLLKVPLAFLPSTSRTGDYLSIGQSKTEFKIESIKIDGREARLPDGSDEFYSLSFASRADQYRLDLIIDGDLTDSDGDGLPDWWEELNGLNPKFADADEDSDGDGWSNQFEFLRGSNPQVSNREPELATMTLKIPELGEAGCFLEFHDSDSAPREILLTFEVSELRGFRVNLDGVPVDSDTLELKLEDIQEGSLSLSHHDSLIEETNLKLSWNDGGKILTGVVTLEVTKPSRSNGNDASLWLDAAVLPVGELISSWIDRSGNGRSAMQPLAENQPIAVSHGSLQSVHFKSPTAHLFFQDDAVPRGDHTILASWSSPSSADSEQVLLSSNRGFFRLEPTEQAVSYPGAPVYQFDGLAVRGFEASPGQSSTGIFRREQVSLRNIFGFSHNGEEVESEGLSPVLPTIGARRSALPSKNLVSAGFKGHLNELMIFPSALPEQKLREVHDYLQSKWSGHVIWDFSNSLSPTQIAVSNGPKNIIRGGHGDDDLKGGNGDTILSGGPGADVLRGGNGLDSFVFGSIDTGADVIVDYDLEVDVIDLSAHFWGESGDARQFLSSRLETRFDTPIPTLDTVLIVERPDGIRQEITLKDTILEEPKIIELVVEGRLRLGGLTIPTEVKMEAVGGVSEEAILEESGAGSFAVEVTRSGAGTAGALEVPMGLFGEALGRDFFLEGDVRKEGQRAVVSFARGENSKIITFRAIPDLEAEGIESIESSILPHYRYTVSGGPVARSVSDDPIVYLRVIEPNALTNGQTARVKVVRSGPVTEDLTVNLELEGTALEGRHLDNVPRTVVIPAGEQSAEISVAVAAGWSGRVTRMALLRLDAEKDYLIGSPHEATIYAGQEAQDPEASGFDRWLAAVTDGEILGVVDLLKEGRSKELNQLLYAYATGENPHAGREMAGLSFQLVDRKPILKSRLSRSAADLRWEVQDAGSNFEWQNVTDSFVEEISGGEVTFIGQPREVEERARLYRLLFSVEQGDLLAEGVERVTSSNRYGLTGPASWYTDPVSGDLTSSGNVSDVPNRLIVEIENPTQLAFEMSVVDGGDSDSFVFYINGEKIKETSGEPVTFSRNIDTERPVLLMWEYRGEDGRPVISDLSPAQPQTGE